VNYIFQLNESYSPARYKYSRVECKLPPIMALIEEIDEASNMGEDIASIKMLTCFKIVEI